MRAVEEVTSELSHRIQADVQAFQGHLPERYSLAWHGYLCGLYEWGIIDLPSYQLLSKLLPPVEPPDPIETIFTGRE